MSNGWRTRPRRQEVTGHESEAIADGVGDGVFPGEVQRRLRHVHRDDGHVVDEDAPFPHGYGKRDGDTRSVLDIGHAERSWPIATWT